MSQPLPDRARQLAAELELRFKQDAELARKLNDVDERLQRANERLWSGLHRDVIAAVYAEHPATLEIVVAENRSQVLRVPDPLRALEETHWAIHQAHNDYQQIAEDRRHLGRHRRDDPRLRRRTWSRRLVRTRGAQRERRRSRFSERNAGLSGS